MKSAIALFCFALVGLALFFHNRHPSSQPNVAKGSAAPKIKWSFATEGPIFGTPAIAADGTIYLASYKFLYALSPDGQLKWKYFPGNRLHSSPVLGTGGEIYVADQSCQIHALNPDGSKVWQSQLGIQEPGSYTEETDLSLEGMCSIRATPALADGILYVANMYGSLFSVEANSGNTVRRFFEVSTLQGSSAAVSANMNILQGTGSSLIALDTNGNIQWAFKPEPSASFGSPAIGSDGTIAVWASDKKLHVLAADGGPKWEAPGSWVSAPVISSEGNIFVADAAQLNAFSSDGKTLWQAPMLRASTAAIAANGNVYLIGEEKAGSGNQRAYALTSDGKLKWALPVAGWSSNSPTISPDGTVYFVVDAVNDGMIYAVQEENGGLSPGGWPKWHGNLSNDGHSAGQR